MNILELSEFNENPDKAKLYCVLFTGNEANEYNTIKGGTRKYLGHTVEVNTQAFTHHWMAVYGNKIFNSYGVKEDMDFKIPDNCEFIMNHPDRLQSYGSNVCGEYVCAFLWFVKNASLDDDDDIGEEFSIEMGLGFDKEQNDHKILEWYEQNK